MLPLSRAPEQALRATIARPVVPRISRGLPGFDIGTQRRAGPLHVVHGLAWTIRRVRSGAGPVAVNLYSCLGRIDARSIRGLKRECGTFHVKLLGDIGATPYIRPSLAFRDPTLPEKCM